MGNRTSKFRRIIIENQSSLPDVVILGYVKTVMEIGRSGNAYAYQTRFQDGIVVEAIVNRTSDRFTIRTDLRNV